jgi:hypothetical protein
MPDMQPAQGMSGGLTVAEVAEWIAEHEANGQPEHDCEAESMRPSRDSDYRICGVCGRAI